MSESARIAGNRPASDVSSAVGLVGLAGLFAWLLICRNWVSVAAYFGMPIQPGPLDGPYASLATLLFTGLPMVAWSVAIEKVHLRSSTGLDWSIRRPISSIIDISVVKLAGLWATWAIIGFLYCVARWYWNGQYLFAMEVIGAAAIPLFLVSIPYVIWLDRILVEPRDGAWHFGAMLIGKEMFDLEEVKSHFRSWAVKGFFCAFMISILPPGFAYIVNLDISTIGSNPVALSMGLIELLFVVDVQMAMVGYLVTLKPLDAQIRSANPYVSGWLAALICYPPFILMGDNGPLNYHVNTADWGYWLDGHPIVLWVWGGWLVFLTGVYAWATVIFGLRFSNLTYRGVITNGPYGFTRHPAYVSKNLFWWFATMPFLVTSGSFTDIIRNTAIMAMVSGVYYWRAKTEEKHLLSEDEKYREYHAWMAENGILTSRLVQLTKRFRPRQGALQPAE